MFHKFTVSINHVSIRLHQKNISQYGWIIKSLTWFSLMKVKTRNVSVSYYDLQNRVCNRCQIMIYKIGCAMISELIFIFLVSLDNWLFGFFNTLAWSASSSLRLWRLGYCLLRRFIEIFKNKSLSRLWFSWAW